MRNRRRLVVVLAVYLAVVAFTAVITGPTVLRGADGMEIGPLLLLGFPCSLILAFVGAWSLTPIGDTASDWGLLLGLVSGSVANAAIMYRRSGRRGLLERDRLG